ncbi:MAG: imidazolonepropionase, partial [Bacteroidales bacterium]|nr:imidazolonepropionase [Bacteroidales bacterium]
MKTLFINIKKLVQAEEGTPDVWRAGKEMSKLDCIDNAFLLTDGDKIEDFGKMDSLGEAFADLV